MLRRPLTRIELKMDDQAELESAIVERLQEGVEDGEGGSTSTSTIDPKKTPTKAEQMKARIGYNPAPVATDGEALR